MAPRLAGAPQEKPDAWGWLSSFGSSTPASRPAPGRRTGPRTTTRSREERAFPSAGYRVVTGSAERVTASQSFHRQPPTGQKPMTIHGFGGVVGARRQESTGAGKIRRNKALIESKQAEGRSHLEPIARGEDLVRLRGGNRLQGRPGWRRAALASVRRPRRNRARSCFDEKPLESVV